jgi:rSAM/selenodomain-associated transferase 2
MPPPLSIIVPVLNEERQIVSILQSLQALRAEGAELIVVDGSSRDRSVALAQPLADAVLPCPPGRATQMNLGARHAQSPRLLFLHADTRLPQNASALIAQALQSAAWGRFDVHIEGRSRWLPVVAQMMNWRSHLSGIATGDQALFMTREAFDAVQGFAEQPLMEDIEMSKRLKRLGRPACLREKVITSGRRWDERGALRTIVLMWRLRWAYWRGTPAAQLAKLYR